METEDQDLLQRAVALHRPIARAASLARRNGLSLLVFGVLSVLVSLIGFDPFGLAIGAVLTWTGLVEYRTSRRLARADLLAPRMLARNELALMAGILVYCVLKLTVLRESGDELSEQLSIASGMDIDLAELTDSLNTLIYTTFSVVTVFYQGGLARYFMRRRAMIESYLRESPEWARRTIAEL